MKTSATYTRVMNEALPRALDEYKNLVSDLPNVIKGYIPPVRDKNSKLFGGEIIVGPKSDGSLEGVVRGSFSGLLGLNPNFKINDETLKALFFGDYGCLFLTGSQVVHDVGNVCVRHFFHALFHFLRCFGITGFYICKAFFQVRHFKA